MKSKSHLTKLLKRLTLTRGLGRIRRGISQHGMFDLMHDALRLGIISQAEIIGLAVGKTIGGSTMEDVGAKYLSALTGARNSKNLAMEADRA